MMGLKNVLPLLALLLSLSACGNFRAFDAAAEPYVDEGFAEIITRLCRAPADIILRQVQRQGEGGSIALYHLCPEYRALANQMFLLMNRSQIAPVGAPEAPSGRSGPPPAADDAQ